MTPPYEDKRSFKILLSQVDKHFMKKRKGKTL